MEGMPSQLVAGRQERLVVHARDRTGCATQGGDVVQVTLDSAAEGRQDLAVKVCNPTLTRTMLIISTQLLQG